ncbi:MAG: hypothetical protein GXO63_01600 [Candidatus Micrarchaeota archaeon]|nr:hypothetical protein [Candidatus Micrarchaeota archaeon]
MKKKLALLSTFLGIEIPEKIERIVSLLAELLRVFINLVIGILKLVFSLLSGKVI